MKKPYSHEERDEKVRCVTCGRPLKKNLIARKTKGVPDKCYECFTEENRMMQAGEIARMKRKRANLLVTNSMLRVLEKRVKVVVRSSVRSAYTLYPDWIVSVVTK